MRLAGLSDWSACGIDRSHRQSYLLILQGIASTSSLFLSSLIGAKMEPGKVAQICLPRSASNRHGFELPLRCSDETLRKMNQGTA
jgi:hypothetical protein